MGGARRCSWIQVRDPLALDRVESESHYMRVLSEENVRSDEALVSGGDLIPTPAMKDVTEAMHQYREGARGLWNSFLRRNATPYVDFDAVEGFAVIREKLFDELVLRSLGQHGFRRANRSLPYPFLRIDPTTDPLSIMIARPTSDRNRYWDDPINKLAQRGVRLAFIDHFDWDDFGYLDFQYYRVQISECIEYPFLVGREALVDVHHARVVFEP